MIDIVHDSVKAYELPTGMALVVRPSSPGAVGSIARLDGAVTLAPVSTSGATAAVAGPFAAPCRVSVSARGDVSVEVMNGTSHALVSGAWKTRTLTKNLAGRVRTYALPGDFTQHLLLELEAPITSVEIGVPNIHSAPVAGVRVRVAVTNQMPAALGNSALITPSGAWTAATFAGASSVTLPARIAAERQSMTYTDAINVQSIARTDGGTRPLLMIQIEYPAAAAQASTPQNGIGGAPSWFSGAGTAGRRLFSATQAVLGITTPGSFTNASTAETTNCVIPAIRYRTRAPGRQILTAGDSTLEGTSVGTTLANPALMAAFALSSPTAPVEVYSVAKHAQPPAIYQASIDDVIAQVRPTHLVYSPYSVNDVSAGGMSVTQLARVYHHTGLALSRAEEYELQVLLLEGLPANEAFRDVGANDSIRRTLNDDLQSYVGSTVAVATGYAAAISGPLDGDGQTTILAGASDDNVHPNVLGVSLLRPFIQAWVESR